MKKLSAFDKEMILANRCSSTMQMGADPMNRQIFLIGEINDNSCYRFLTALSIIDNEPGPIMVTLCSPGGEEGAGYAIYDAIKSANNHVIMQGIGSVYSIAAAIFQAADYRLMTPECKFMIHNGTISMPHELQQNSLQTLAKESKESNQRYYKILADRSGLKLSQIEKFCHDETYWDSEKAVEMGFADSLLTPSKPPFSFDKLINQKTRKKSKKSKKK